MQALRGVQPRSFTSGRPCCARRVVTVKAAVAAKPATVPVKSADGADVGIQSMALNVAPESSARGLVHRYLVFVRQNARRVSAAMPRGCMKS